MITMQPYVKKWYDFLDEGKFMGTRCKRCGSYEFPPLPICNSCSSTDMEWVEMSGVGKMVSFSANFIVDPPFADFGPSLHAVVELAEGPTFISWILGVDFEQQAELFEKLPLDVKMVVHTRGKYKYPVFELVK